MARMIYLGLGLLLLAGPVAEARVGFHAGGHAGMGKLGGQTPAHPSFAAGHFDLQLMPGWRFSSATSSTGGATGTGAGAGSGGGRSGSSAGPRLMAGVLLEYRFVSQLEESRPSYPDQSGTSFLWGLGATLESGNFKLLATWDPAARYTVKSPGGTYKGSGFHAILGWQFEPGWYLDLQFATTRYDTYAALGGSDQDLGGLDRMRHWNIGLGGSYSY